MNILKMPQPVDATPPKAGASRWAIWKGRMWLLLGRILKRLGIPGALQDTTINDPVTGQDIRVSVGTLFTKISVNGRDYYFHRLSGRYDGAGLGCS